MSWWQRIAKVFRGPPATASRLAAISDESVSVLRPRLHKEPFQADDVVVLRDRGKLFKLSRPLSPGGQIGLAKGNVAHDSIVGKYPGDVVHSSSGVRCRVEEPSLADYVTNSRRIVTPIYPDDAEKIVSKLDINSWPASTGDKANRFEILEAGTGHGSLTLHLSRAISAFNSPFPQDAAQYDQWRAQRRAVVHTVEISAKHSKHARKVVKEFRRGMYLHNVDFHVGSVSDWVKDRQASKSSPFLMHAFLDLPSPTDHLAIVGSALLPTGKLMVFAPSITTILECYALIKREKLDLWHSTTIEFANNGGTGGREWDLRQVVPRKAQPKARDTGLEDGDLTSESEESVEQEPEQTEEPDTGMSQDLKWVCRPKVGDRINGGGFLGIFEKLGH